MSYSPYDKPQTLAQRLYQISLGSMGCHTGTGASNHAGLEQRRLQQERERRERSTTPWWETDTNKK